MATITVDIPDAVKELLDRKAKARRVGTSGRLGELLIAEAVRNQWRDEVDQRLRGSLAEYERGEGVPWSMGDCEKMVRDFLKKKKLGKRKKP